MTIRIALVLAGMLVWLGGTELARADTPLTEEVKQHIYSQLDLATRRFNAILG